jgi:hypothetical protein
MVEQYHALDLALALATGASIPEFHDESVFVRIDGLVA